MIFLNFGSPSSTFNFHELKSNYLVAYLMLYPYIPAYSSQDLRYSNMYCYTESPNTNETYINNYAYVKFRFSSLCAVNLGYYGNNLESERQIISGTPPTLWQKFILIELESFCGVPP